MLIVDDDEIDGEFSDNPSQIEEIAHELVLAGDVSSLNSLAGKNNPHSLRVIGTFKGKELLILIDSGSTHNFVQPAVIERLKIQTQSTTPFHVYIGNGDTLTCSKWCPKTELMLNFEVDLHVLPIKGPDLVLGVQWLQKLGVVKHDYGKVSMEFEWNREKVKLQGEPAAAPQAVSFSQLQALIVTNNIDQFYKLHQVAQSVEEESMGGEEPDDQKFMLDIPEDLVVVLTQFKQLFVTPTVLPPKREYDHRIHLLPNSKPVNVKPYRYPHFQKNEMERLVKEMLQQGIIRPSKSSYSSPVLLVKKKMVHTNFAWIIGR